MIISHTIDILQLASNIAMYLQYYNWLSGNCFKQLLTFMYNSFMQNLNGGTGD